MTSRDDTPPSTTAARQAAWERAIRQIQRDLADAVGETRAEVEAILTETRARILGQLAETPTDWQVHHLSALRAEVDRALMQVRVPLVDAVDTGLDAAWATGVRLVDAPVQAAFGVELGQRLPSVDVRQLAQVRAFTVGKVSDLALDAAAKVKTELGVALAGGQTPFDAAQAVAAQLQSGGVDRAVRLVTTELGTACSAATQARQEQAVTVLPKMQKQWRRSGKLHSRLTHDLADGQIADVERPFLVGGIEIMYPRHPDAPAKHRVWCGCTSLPWMSDWEMQHPLEKPITDDERSADRNKHNIDDVRRQGFDQWAAGILDRTAHPVGAVKTVGQLGDDVARWLRREGISTATSEIAVSDRAFAHLVRDAKVSIGKAVPASVARRLPGIIADPLAVLWDLRADAPTLHYITAVPGDDRLARISVKLRDHDRRLTVKRHNNVVSAGMVDRRNLRDANTYRVVTGGV